MKTIKSIRYFIICFATIILEMLLGKYLAVHGAVPMLSYCLCIVIATKEKDFEYILYIGAFVGIIIDLLLGHGFGVYTAIFIASVWITYLLRDIIFSSLALFLVIDSFILTVLSNVVYYLLHFMDVGINLGEMFSKIAFPSAIYNTVLCLMIYFILKPTLYKRR